MPSPTLTRSPRTPKEYINKILRSAKDIELLNIRNQLNIIYNNIDLKLRLLRLSRPKSSLNEFISDLDKVKYN